MRMFAPVCLAIVLLIWSATARLDAAVTGESIRVAIAKNALVLKIDGDGLLALNENGFPVSITPPVMVNFSKDSVNVDGASYRRLVFASSAAVFVNGKPYRGLAEITPAEKGLLVVNELALEDYLVGLINSEISSAWPIEAVKAQAVIARTYALNRKKARSASFYHLESTVIDQVYDGCQAEDSRARRAVNETAGEVLTYGATIIQAFYHSNCGGKTEASENVWGASLPYLKGVDCKYCAVAPSSAWFQKIPLKDIEEKLRAAGFKEREVIDLKAGPRNGNGRLTNIVIVLLRGSSTVSVAIPGDQFRKIIGYGIIKSTNFTVKAVRGEAEFSGSGNGHGVGLCQWGSKQRALDGFSYNEILLYYYPGTELKKLSGIR